MLQQIIKAISKDRVILKHKVAFEVVVVGFLKDLNVRAIASPSPVASLPPVWMLDGIAMNRFPPLSVSECRRKLSLEKQLTIYLEL